MFSGYDESEELAREEKRKKKLEKELADTKPRKVIVAHVPFQESFTDDLLGLKAHRHIENFVQDVNDTQPVKAIRRNTDTEDTKPRKVVRLPSPRIEKFKFSWAAFFVMLISIGTALLVGTLIPGLLDEILAAIVISAVNAFISAHRNK